GGRTTLGARSLGPAPPQHQRRALGPRGPRGRPARAAIVADRRRGDGVLRPARGRLEPRDRAPHARLAAPNARAGPPAPRSRPDFGTGRPPVRGRCGESGGERGRLGAPGGPAGERPGRPGAGEQVNIARARASQARSRYEQTVLVALREVEDALVGLRTAQDRSGAQERQVIALRRALDLATMRYQNGVSSYLDVLDAQRGLFGAELALTQAERDQLVAAVELYRAVGPGGPAGDP